MCETELLEIPAMVFMIKAKLSGSYDVFFTFFYPYFIHFLSPLFLLPLLLLFLFLSPPFSNFYLSPSYYPQSLTPSLPSQSYFPLFLFLSCPPFSFLHDLTKIFCCYLAKVWLPWLLIPVSHHRNEISLSLVCLYLPPPFPLSPLIPRVIFPSRHYRVSDVFPCYHFLLFYYFSSHFFNSSFALFLFPLSRRQFFLL